MTSRLAVQYIYIYIYIYIYSGSNELHSKFTLDIHIVTNSFMLLLGSDLQTIQHITKFIYTFSLSYACFWVEGGVKKGIEEECEGLEELAEASV